MHPASRATMLSPDSDSAGNAQPLVQELLQQFELSPNHVRNITRHFVQHMKDGLTHSRPWQLPSYVYRIPDGTEKGSFLAVDLGGTNCRICLVDLLGDSTYKVVQTKQAVPVHLRTNPRYKPLFRFIAEAISGFLSHHALHPQANPASAAQSIRLGFTFSFTCEQTSISQGTLIQWDKGWDIPEALGKDPCAMLQECIDEMKLPVHVSALANDSVGTLLSRAYTSPGKDSTLAGVIIGTGTNAAYIESLSNVQRLGSTQTKLNHDSIVINTEWGCFDDELQVLPTTSYDRDLDINSTNPGSQQLEKRVSGMYLGELMRLVILHCQNQGALDMVLNDASPCHRQYGIDSSFLSLLAGDASADRLGVSETIERVLLARNVTPNDVQTMQHLAKGIVNRSARLAGSALAAIIIQSGRLSRPQFEKHTAQVTTLQTHQPPTQLSKIRSRGCGLFASIVKCFKTSTNDTSADSLLHQSALTKSNIASGDTLHSEIEEEVIDIGVDGSLIELYPGFQAYMRSALRDVPEIGPEGERRVRMGIARDGSGVGAALMANAVTTM